MTRAGGATSVRARRGPRERAVVAARWRSSFDGILERASVRWWVVPLAIWLLGRAITTVFLVVGARRQVPMVESSPGYTVHFPTVGDPGYWVATTNWDGQWYKQIALHGYPSTLPIVNGSVAQNEWAFYPLYPGMCRALMEVTGLPFEVVAPLLSTVLGGIAVVLLYRLLLVGAGRFVAAATVLCLTVFPASPVLQVAYTESLALLLIVLVMWALRSRRYLLVLALCVPLSLTRGIAPAMAICMGVYWILRWWHWREDPFERLEMIRVAGLTLAVGALAGLWPFIVGLATGTPDGFMETQRAWRVNQDRAILNNWWSRIDDYYGPVVATVVMLAILPLLVVLFRRATRVWGPELRAWAFAYTAFLLLVTSPGSSTIRFLVLVLAPMWPFPDRIPTGPQARAAHRRRVWALGVVCVLWLVLQYVAVTEVFTIPVEPGNGRPYP